MDSLGGAATDFRQSVEGGVNPENNSMFRDFYIGQLRGYGHLQELTGVVATRLKGSTAILCFDSPLSPDTFLLPAPHGLSVMNGRTVAPIAGLAPRYRKEWFQRNSSLLTVPADECTPTKC
jgi:hypothetical protein